MSHDEFFNTYFTGQKELSVMAAMGPSERAQFLSRVLGYERLRTAQDLVRERRKALDRRDHGASRRHARPGRRAARARRGRGPRGREQRRVAVRARAARPRAHARSTTSRRSGKRCSASATRCRRSSPSSASPRASARRGERDVGSHSSASWPRSAPAREELEALTRELAALSRRSRRSFAELERSVERGRRATRR